MTSRRRRAAEQARRFEALYVAHYPAVYAYVYRRLGGSGAETADAVADVFVAAWRRLDRVPEGADARLWLYGTARNTVHNHRRGGRRRRRLFDRLTEDAQTEPSTQTTPGADDWLVLAIGRLAPADQEVLRLVAWEGISHNQAAQVLGCSINAVALRVRKAKQRLREDPVVAAHLNRSQPDPERALSSPRK